MASALGERSYSSAAGRRRSLVKTGTAEQPHGRTRTNTDGHGRLERAEVRGQGKQEQPNSHLTQETRGTQKDRKRFLFFLEPET